MALQTISGLAKSLGSTTAGGSVVITPAEYPQNVGGTLITTVPVTVTITAGVFSFQAMCGSKIHVKAKDSLDRVFLNISFQVSNDATADISNYIPSAVSPIVGTTGFVQSIGGRSGILTDLYADKVNYSTVYVNSNSAEGDVWWNPTDHTLNVQSDVADAVLQVGQEMWIRGLNKTGAPLTDGTVVYVNSAQGNRPTLAEADADIISGSAVIGVVTSTIADNTEGFVTILGLVRNFNTSTYVAGDELYLSSTAGLLTKTAPSSPANVVRVGYALNATNNGAIYVCPTLHLAGNTALGSDNTIAPTQLAVKTAVDKKVTSLQTVDTNTSLSISNSNGYIKLLYQQLFSHYNLINLYVDGVDIISTRTRLGTVTNNTTFEADGTMVANGAATVWNDMLGNASNIKTTGVRVAINDAEQTIDFNTSSVYPTDYAWTSYQLKHEWKLGSSINPHIHWQQTSNASPNWLFEYRWQTQGGAKTTAWTKLPLTTHAFTYTAGTINQITHGAAVTPPVGYSLSDILQFRLYRDMTNASTSFAGVDTYTGTANVTSVDIHIECDMLGSRDQFTK